MKIFFLTMTALNFVMCFPYNGSQEIQSQTNQHLSASLPLSNHTANKLSSILIKEENSPTEDSNTYYENPDGVTKISGSHSKTEHWESLQDSVYNFPSSENDVLSGLSPNQASTGFAYVERAVESSAEEGTPESYKSPSSDAMQDTSVINTAVSSFEPNPQISQWMLISRENSVLTPVPMNNYRFKSHSYNIPQTHTDSETTQNLEHFSFSGRSRPLFASNPATNIQNSIEELSALEDESTIDTSNTDDLLETIIDEESNHESISTIDTMAFMEEGSASKSDSTGISEEEEDRALFGMSSLEDDVFTIESAYVERDGKITSNELDLPQKDNFIVIDDADIKNYGITPANDHIPGIFSAKNSKDIGFFPRLNTYDRADTQSIKRTTDTDNGTSNIHPINSTNYFLNYKMHDKNNIVVGNPTDSKVMMDRAKHKAYVGGLITSKTNVLSSTDHYQKAEPINDGNLNFKIRRPDDRHTVQMESVIMPKNNEIVEVTGFNLDDSMANYDSKVLANMQPQNGRENLHSINTNESEKSVDQDDEIIDTILTQPDSSTADSREESYSVYPTAHYAQTSGGEIPIPMDNPVPSLLFRHKMKPLTTEKKSLANNKSNQGTSIPTTSIDGKTETDFQKTTKTPLFKGFQNNIVSIVSSTDLADVGPVYFSEDGVPDMTSASQFNSPSSAQPADSMNEAIISLYINDTAGSMTGADRETDFPVHKQYILPSAVKLPTLISSVQNNEAQTSSTTENDSLKRTWVERSDLVTEKLHLTDNGAIIHNQADLPNILPKSTFLIADFTSPRDEQNATVRRGKGTMNVPDGSELKVNKAATTKGQPSAAATSLPTARAGALILRQQLRNLSDKEMDTDKESILYTEEESVIGEDAVFQENEDIPSTSNVEFVESRDGSLEKDEFLDTDAANSLSQFSVIPTTELTISDKDFITSKEENFDALYPSGSTNSKRYLKPMASKAIGNSLDKSKRVKQNIKKIGDIVIPSPNSVPQIERLEYTILPNIFHNIISDNSLNASVMGPNVDWNTIKTIHSTMKNGANHSGGYQTTTDVTLNKANRLTNKGKTDGNAVTNSPLDITNIENDNFSEVYKGLKGKADLSSISTPSPIKEDIMTVNSINKLENKVNQLTGSLPISRDNPSVARDVETSNTATPLASIITPKTYLHNKAIPTALKADMVAASQGDYPRYETDYSFEGDTVLNSETELSNEESILANEENELQEEKVGDYIYVIPIANDNVPKGNHLATTRYSPNSDVYDSTRFRRISKTRVHQPEVESPVNEALKPPLGKFNPEVQRKMFARNNNNHSDHHDLFDDNSLYPMMKENVPEGFIFSPKRQSTTAVFRLPMVKLPGKNTRNVTKTSFMAPFNPLSTTKMPADATNILPNVPDFESKKSNENNNTAMPNTDGMLPITLKSLLIPKQKMPRSKVLSGDNDVLSAAVVTSEGSEPGDHFTFTDQSWEIINDQNAAQSFSQVPSAPLADPMTFSEKATNGASDIHITENRVTRDKTDSVALSPNAVLQPAPHNERGLDKAVDSVSNHIQQTRNGPPAKRRAPPATEANAFFSNSEDVVEETYISEENIPVNSRKLNTAKAAPFIFRSEATSPEKKGSRNPKEASHVGSTKSTTKLTKVRATDSLSLDKDNWEQPVQSSYNELYHLPLQVTFSPTDFIESSDSEHDPEFTTGESIIGMTDDSVIPDDVIALPDSEVISFDMTVFGEDLRNARNTKQYAGSVERNGLIQYEGIPFTKDISAESEFFPAEGNKPNADLMPIGLDDSTPESIPEENNFYAGEKGTSPTAKISIFPQGEISRGLRLPVLTPTAVAPVNLLKDNTAESKSKHNYQVQVSRERNSESYDDRPFFQESPNQSYSKPHGITSVSLLANQHGKYSPNISDDLTLERDDLNGSEGEGTEHIHISDSEPMVAMRESRTFPSETTGLTMSSTLATQREQLPRKGASSAAFSILREAKVAISLDSEYDKDQALRARSTNAEDSIAPSLAEDIDLESEFSFVYEDVEAKILQQSTSSSPMKTANSMADVTDLSLESSYEWDDSMPPEANSAPSEEFLPLLTTESITLIPTALTDHSVFTRENLLTESSELPALAVGIRDYDDLVRDTDDSQSKVMNTQTDFHPYTLNSAVQNNPSRYFIKKSTQHGAGPSSPVDRVAEMQHSQDTIIPLSEFSAILDDELPFASENSDISNMTVLSDSPLDTAHTVDESRGDSVLPGDASIGYRGALDLQTPENAMLIPDVSTENLEISDPFMSKYSYNSPTKWSDTFDRMTDYPNSINVGDTSNGNENDLIAYSSASTKLPFGFTDFSGNPTSEFNSVVSPTTKIVDVYEFETDAMYSKPPIENTKANSLTKISQNRMFKERNIPKLSDDNTDNTFNLQYITDAAGLNTLSDNYNDMEEKIHTSEAGNFLPKDASTLRDNVFAVKLDDSVSTRPYMLSNSEGLSSVGSIVNLPEAFRSNNQGSNPEAASQEGTKTNTPTPTHSLQSTFPPEFTTVLSSSKHSELDPIIKMGKDGVTTTNNNIASGEGNTLSNGVSQSMNDMKSTNYMTRFEDKTFTEEDISSELVLFEENVSEVYDAPFTHESTNDENIANDKPTDHDLKDAVDAIPSY